jgi:hypothetical protein
MQVTSQMHAERRSHNEQLETMLSRLHPTSDNIRSSVAVKPVATVGCNPTSTDDTLAKGGDIGKPFSPKALRSMSTPPAGARSGAITAMPLPSLFSACRASQQNTRSNDIVTIDPGQDRTATVSSATQDAPVIVSDSSTTVALGLQGSQAASVSRYDAVMVTPRGRKSARKHRHHHNPTGESVPTVVQQEVAERVKPCDRKAEHANSNSDAASHGRTNAEFTERMIHRVLSSTPVNTAGTAARVPGATSVQLTSKAALPKRIIVSAEDRKTGSLSGMIAASTTEVLGSSRGRHVLDHYRHSEIRNNQTLAAIPLVKAATSVDFNSASCDKENVL